MTPKMRRIGWGVPLACILLSAAGVLVQARRLSEADAALALARGEVAKATKERKTAEEAQGDHRFGAAEPGSTEELSFIDELRRQAQARGLTIKALGASTVTLLDKTQATPEDQKKLEGIREVATNITLTGPYLGLRAFLDSVTTRDRLCNVKAMKWERVAGGSEMSVTLARYVKAPGVAK